MKWGNYVAVFKDKDSFLQTVIVPHRTQWLVWILTCYSSKLDNMQTNKQTNHSQWQSTAAVSRVLQGKMNVKQEASGCFADRKTTVLTHSGGLSNGG